MNVVVRTLFTLVPLIEAKDLSARIRQKESVGKNLSERICRKGPVEKDLWEI
jgi:hypothetical protein